MARIYQGATDVNIPIDAILKEYSGWVDEILDRLASLAVDKIRANAKQFNTNTGILKRRIKKKRSKYNEHSCIAGAMAPHAHLLEYGHALVRNGQVYGHVPAHPFVRPAEEAVKKEVMQVVKDVLGDKYIEVGGK